MTPRRRVTRMWLLAAALVALPTTGCISYLQPGQFGLLRYFGEVVGGPPLNLIPPITDRNGNVYVLYGARDLINVEAFVGKASGGWSSGCTVDKADGRGAHGWVGFSTDRAWYWAGDQLVQVTGSTGSCQAVLNRDPSSAADLQFLGVIPNVVDTPSRTFLNALIISPDDRVPYYATVDLNLLRYTSVRRFDPASATNVVVLGVGAEPNSDTGFMLVKYDNGGQTVVEGIFLDRDGNVIAKTPVQGASALDQDAVVGYLESVDGQFVAGLLSTGDVVVFDRHAGTVHAVTSLKPVGVHRWGGKLWMVGTSASGGQPAVAPIARNGTIGQAVVWQASQRAAAAMKGKLQIVDDRTDPRRRVLWNTVTPAMGPFPFVQPFSPEPYAVNTTGWLVAGPSYMVAGEPHTSVAFGPVGISYP